MNDDDLNKIRGIVKEEVTTALEPVNKNLESVNKKLNTLWEQTDKLTVDMSEVKESLSDVKKVLKSHIQTSSQTDENLGKVNRRLTTVEDQMGIVPPVELVIN